MPEYNSEPMNGVDTAWLRMDRPTNLMVITAMTITEKLEFTAFREIVRQRFLAFERFRKKPVQRSGLYFWELDPHFDLDAHLRLTALPGRADRAELQRFVSELISTPLDYSKPLWQFHFIENYGDQCVIVMRVHHCYADGLSLVAVFGALTDEQPRPVVAASEIVAIEVERPAANDESVSDAGYEPWKAYQQIMEAALRAVEKYTRMSLRMTEESLHLLHEPASIKSIGRLMLQVVGEVSSLAARASDPKTSIKGVLGIGKACVWSEPLALDHIKDIGRQMGGSVNDLLLSCVTGLLRRYLSQSQTIGVDFEVHATVPVNIRFPDELAESEATKDIGNRFGTVFMALPVGVENPVERIYRIRHEMQLLRRSMQPDISYALMAAVGMMPAGMQHQVMDVFSSKSSLVLSNVPGTQQPRYLAGSKIQEAMYWVPQTGDVAVGISLLSYNGQVQVGVVVDKRVVKDPQVMVDAFALELEAHEASLPKVRPSHDVKTFNEYG